MQAKLTLYARGAPRSCSFGAVRLWRAPRGVNGLVWCTSAVTGCRTPQRWLSSGTDAVGATPSSSATHVATTSSSSSAMAAVDSDALMNTAFLEDLLNPPETVPLEDATRTYRTMDLVDDCHVYDPSRPNITNLPPSSSTQQRPDSLAAAHAAGVLWLRCATATETERAALQPPRWFEQLCRELYFGEGEVEAPAPEASVDPYTWLPFQLRDVADYGVGPYVFPATCTYTDEERQKLCLGHVGKEYVHFCDTYAFPQRYQLPTSVGTEPARLLMDPACPQEVVYLQLGPDLPPALWLPIKGTAAAVRRVVRAFASEAAAHRDRHHAALEARMEQARQTMRWQRLPETSAGDVLRFLAYDARNTQYADAPIQEFPNSQEFFLGEYHDPEAELLERFDFCPLLFSIAPMRTVTDPHAEHATPTIDGPGVAPSLYRCIYSKALILVSVQLSAEVKLPPQDPEAFQFLWKDAQAIPKMKIPVFARVLWPSNPRLCGGGLLARRFNAAFGTEFAHDMPPDALLTLFSTSRWAGRGQDLLGVRGLRERVAAMEAAALGHPHAPQLYPGTREVPNPEYSLAERLGMHVQYLSMVGDPEVTETVRLLLARPGLPAAVRMGCAKAALIAGDRALFREIVSQEPPGRMQHYMTRLTRKRKTRDLVDPEPRLLDDQFEFAAPLWTKRGTRIDRNTLEGAVDAAATRLAR